jgi:membrane-associated phospholipid phosphatase
MILWESAAARLVPTLMLVSLFTAQAAAQTPAAQTQAAAERRGIGSDLKAYVTSPARWDGRDWLELGGALAAIGIAYQRDDDVREHFAPDTTAGASTSREDLQAALPGALALGGTWLYAKIIDDDDRRREAAAMTEAAVLGTVTAYVLKAAAGRTRPDETIDSSSWHSGGDSFPSGHVTAAFAIGTVLAESGNDSHRRLRRVLGYGLAAGTAYQRLDHNAHWFSDTVAGAALGLGTARFVMKRREQSERHAAMEILPLDGGFALSYAVALR